MDLRPYLFCLSFYLLFVFLPPFEDNGLLFWVPDVLCWHSELVLWNLLSIQMVFWWICGGESGFPILFLHHLRTSLPLIFLKRSLVFPILLFSSISLHWSLRKVLSVLAILRNSAFKGYIFSPLAFASLLFSAICKALSDNHFAFLHFLFLGMVLIPASCMMPLTSVHSSSGTLSDLIPWIYFSVPLYNHKGFDLGHTWMV